MIQRLFIRNYALIDSLEIDFRPGFTVLTGETGAGKSIILGALSLILGQRADSKAIKDAAQKTVIEGTFDVSAYEMRSFLRKMIWTMSLPESVFYAESCRRREKVGLLSMIRPFP